MFKTINIPSLRALGLLGGLFDMTSMIPKIVSREPVFSEPERTMQPQLIMGIVVSVCISSKMPKKFENHVQKRKKSC